MDTFSAGANVTLTIPFQDASGNAIVPTGVSYRVIDELENQIVATTTLAVTAGATSIDITIPAGSNQLAPTMTSEVNGEQVGTPIISTSGLREVDVTFTTAAGVIMMPIRYMIGQPTQLYLMQNTFQPYNQSLLTAAGMPNLNGWNLAGMTDGQRITALQEAWTRLTRLGYFVRWPIDPDAQNYINWGTTQNEVIIPRLWSVMSTDRWFYFYPEIFRVAMRKAQVAEADQILSGDLVRQKRNDGIISEKTGESSMMFRSRKPLDLGVSQEALSYLTGYIDFRMKITRS